MADIRCRKCGEPWDADTIHEEVAERAYLGEETTYSAVAAEFNQKGCQAFRAFTGKDEPCKVTTSISVRSAYSAMADLGLTPDEIERELEDFGVLS